MRTSLSLVLALAPAVALVAQAPAPLKFTATLKASGPAIEADLKDFHPAEALVKAEALLPATKPVFDATDPNKARISSGEFSSLARLYHVAARAAIASGDWAKGRTFMVKAAEVTKESADKLTASLTPILDVWKAPIADAKKNLAEGEARLKELRALAAPSDQEKAELANFKTWEDNVKNGEKLQSVFGEDIRIARDDVKIFQTKLEEFEKKMADEKAETERDVQAKFKGNLGGYLESIFNATVLEGMKTQVEKLNFLHRTLFRVREANIGLSKARKAAKKLPLDQDIEMAIGKVVQGQDPFKKAPAPKKAPKAKKG